jgi:H+/Cl- antiporter ClcA
MLYSMTSLIALIVGLILTFVLLLLPIGLVLRRIGRSEWWALIIFIPFGFFIGLWFLAYSRWPLIDGRGKK